MRAAFAKFVRARDGSIAVMSALSGVCVVGCLAFAVDVGSLHLERRKLQNVADLAAVAAVSNLSSAQTAATSIITANGVTATMQVETGTFTADPAINPSLRYTSGGASPNAARITLTSQGTLYFARVIYGGAPPEIRVRATAAQENVAEFSIGTRLASISQGMVNDVLSDFLGSNVTLTVMDYEGLANADIDLVKFMQALAAEVGVTSGTYESVLDTNMTFGNVLDAAALVASGAGANAAEIALNKLELTPGGVYALPLDGRELLDLGALGDLSVGETPAGFVSEISALDLVRSAVIAAGPSNQVQFSFGTSVPGLASLTMSAVIGEPPQGTSWITLGPEGATVYSAQARVRVVADVGPLSVIGHSVSLQVPMALDIAQGSARLANITCGSNPAEDATVRLAVRPAIGSFHIGNPDDFGDWAGMDTVGYVAAQIVNVASIVTVSASASASATNNQDVMVQFDVDDIADRTVKTVNTSTPLSSLIASAFGNLSVSGQLVGIGLPILVTQATSTVRTALEPIGDTVEPLLQNFLDTLGISLGEADVRVYGVRCGAPALVM